MSCLQGPPNEDRRVHSGLQGPRDSMDYDMWITQGRPIADAAEEVAETLELVG